MDKLKSYGKKFLIGAAIGVAVWAGMAALGAMGVVTFGLEAGLVGATLGNPVYAGMFFGVIQAASAAIPDFFGPLLDGVFGKDKAAHAAVKDSPSKSHAQCCAKACHKQTSISQAEYAGRVQAELQREIY